jgi:hypothetical protein
MIQLFVGKGLVMGRHFLVSSFFATLLSLLLMGQGCPTTPVDQPDGEETGQTDDTTDDATDDGQNTAPVIPARSTSGTN